MNERMKLVRKHMRMTQSDFAARIGVTRDVVASWENGRVETPEAVVRLLCREQGISYDWLRNGLEPMFVPADALLADKLECIMAGDNTFVKAALRELIDLPTEAWEQIGAFVDRLYALRQRSR